jgi:hypothetical protein
MGSNPLSTSATQYVEYLAEIGVNYRVGIQTYELCSDTMLNHLLSQKLKLIGYSKLIHLINALTKHNKC